MHKLEETIPYAFLIYLKCWQQSAENSFSENPHLHIYCKQWNPAKHAKSIPYDICFKSFWCHVCTLVGCIRKICAQKKTIALKGCRWSLKFFQIKIFTHILSPTLFRGEKWYRLMFNFLKYSKATLQCILKTIKLSILDTHSTNFLFECISYARVGPKELDCSLWYRSGFRTFLTCICFDDITKIPKVLLFKSIFCN